MMASPAAVCVVEDTDTAGTLAPLVPERCILIGMVGLGGGMCYDSRLLMGRVEGTRFITLHTSMVLLIGDLAGEEIIPIAGGLTYPVEGMPLLAFGVLTEAIMGPLRARARQLLVPHWGAAPLGAALEASWRVNDTAHVRFGEAVCSEVLSVPGYLEVRCFFALALIEGSWVSTEQVVDAEATMWKAEKRSGVVRDPRFLPHSVSETGVRQLFATCWRLSHHGALLNKTVSTGTSAVANLGDSIAASGMEPPQYLAPKFQAFVAGVMKDVGRCVKQLCLAQEEDASQKEPKKVDQKKRSGGGKDDTKKSGAVGAADS